MIQERIHFPWSPSKISMFLKSPISILLSAILFAIAAQLLISSFFGPRIWLNELLHTSTEVSGALIALILAPLVQVQKTRGQEQYFCIWISCALVTMGLFDMVHAFLPVGSIFYLTRALGSFLGGLFLTMVWLPPGAVKGRWADRLPWIVGFASAAIGLIIYATTQNTPASPDTNQMFEFYTHLLNNLGSFGFLVAASFFLFGIPKQDAKTNNNFAIFCLLMASATLLFFFAGLWTPSWWFFHFLRLGAFFSLVYLVTLTFKQSLRLAHKTNLELEREVARRTIELETENRLLKNEIQEQTQSEAKELRIRNQFEAILRAMKDQVIVFDSQGRLLYFNHPDSPYASEPNIDYRFKDLRYFQDQYELLDFNGNVIPFEDWPANRVLRGETIAGCEYIRRWRRLGGEWYFHYTGEPVFDENRNQIMAVIIARDVTEIKKAEFKLKESEKNFRQMADCMPQIFWTSENTGNPSFYNQRWFDYTGLSRSSFNDDSGVSVIHPEDSPGCVEKWKQSRKTGEPLQMECRLRRKDGEYRWHLIRAVQFKTAGTDQVRWFGTSTDIHDHRMLLQKVKEAQDHLCLATGAAEIETWDLNLTTGEIKASLTNHKILSTAIIEDQSFENFRNRVFPEDRKLLSEALEKAIREHTVYTCEYRIKDHSGQMKWVFARGRPMYDSNNKAVRMYGVTIDITDRKKMEEQLREALNRANEANKLKSAFLANMSHEIRTPLGAILGFTDLLRENNLTHDERQYFFEVINRNGEQLSTLINDILDLSKVETGNFNVEILKTDFRKILQEVMTVQEMNAQKKNLLLKLHVDDDVPFEIGTDPTRLKQILTNVIGNAIKFTNEGFVHVHAMKNGDNQLRIQVQDSGVGLDDAQKDLLFQPFSQADPSTTRKFGGTGLGLVLSRKLANALGGDLVILSSKPGVGSIFEIQLVNHLLKEKYPEPAQTRSIEDSKERKIPH